MLLNILTLLAFTESVNNSFHTLMTLWENRTCNLLHHEFVHSSLCFTFHNIISKLSSHENAKYIWRKKEKQSRRLDRCDRMMQNESRVPNGGNVCLFSAATCTAQCRLRSLRANARLSALFYTFRESLAALSIAMAFSR